MRILHTSDWHLGHSLHQMGREREHQLFIDWLVELSAREAVDAMVITGDVFDNANPPAVAQQMWFDFLHRVTRAVSGIEVVVIAGNHDSPSRLEAPASLLSAMGVRIVGRVGYVDGELDTGALVIPLHKDGRARAQVAAVPFLRPADLPPAVEGSDAIAGGVTAIYENVCAHARGVMGPGQSLVVTGHLYASGCDVSKMSERRVLGGHEHVLGSELFPADATYVALGHLHKAQRVGGKEEVRYAGSPIPLSLSEAGYRHQVVIAELDGPSVQVQVHPVPRAIEILRIPKRGSAAIDEILEELAALPAIDSGSADLRPYLEVVVRLDEPLPNLRHELETALEGKYPRLVKASVEYTGTGDPLAVSASAELRDLEPEEVFVRRYQRDHDGEVPADLLAAFRDALSAAHEEAEA
ncbi:MAG: exonuclease SbcCD subunit D C-terminal domain-containing protein [Deltaproteobacteria bacterium]|nr:exonuclease SbcCD subunit D C-terminal domain-containing protein [Deltaproteobacteria bacterium]